MKICRFENNRIGVLTEDDVVLDVTDAVGSIRLDWPLRKEDPFIARLSEILPRLRDACATAPRRQLQSIRLQSPVANPPKIVAAPVNYRRHLNEVLAEPELHHGNAIKEIRAAGLFLKSPTSLIGPDQPVLIRFPERRNDHEIELVAIIGREADRVSPDDALQYVAGYAIGLDMTVRGSEDRSLRKSPDSYSVLGPWMVTADEFGDPGDVDFELTVNGELRQKANTRDLLLGVAELIAFATSFYTLKAGDLLFTGTPEGVGPVVPGDVIHAKMSKIGEMRIAVS